MVPGVLLTGILDQDLDAVLDRTRSVWAEMNGARLLLTGATGFVGTHLLESVRHARVRARVDTRVVASVRHPDRLHARLPWTRDAAWLEVVPGDVRRFAIPRGTVDLAVHAANTASPREIADDPVAIAKMVVEGSTRVCAAAAAAGARRVLQVSSGSVYGAHHAPAPAIAEDDPGEPEGEAPAQRLARAKWDAERALLLAACESSGPPVVVARGFALCGPWLPSIRHSRSEILLGAAMRGERIVVNGDGTPVRSYLYSADLVVWLLTLLLRGTPGRAYNVGSERAITVEELAHRVAALLGGAVEVLGAPVPGARAHWHVPDTTRAREELGLEETVPLNDAIVRTAKWWGERGADAARGSRGAP